jgi:hypothetical protein
LQNKGVWPGSRVELLQFYNEENYRRKANEFSLQLQDTDTVFTEWGRFAYRITELDQGTAIPVQMLYDNDVSTVEFADDMIFTGKRCGILEESKEGYDHLIRFKHHRFQEFFTAYYIHKAQPEISWMEKLDTPRWQETMLNLILMGGHQNVLEGLADSITQSVEHVKKLSEDEPASESGEENVVSVSDNDETVLSDRVELASRVMRQIKSGNSPVSNVLMPPLNNAIGYLADKGNPITQVKMMKACQNIPDIDYIDTLKRPLNSEVNWVRNQALILLADNRSSRAIGSDLPSEMGYDIANGLFLNRLPGYIKATYTSGKIKYWWCMAMALLCSLINIFLYLSLAGFIYYYYSGLSIDETAKIEIEVKEENAHITKEKMKVSSNSFVELLAEKEKIFRSNFLPFLKNQISIACYVAVILTSAFFSLKDEPTYVGAIILGIAFLGMILMYFIINAWLITSLLEFIYLTISSILLVIIGYFITLISYATIGMSFHFAALSLYLFSVARMRPSNHKINSFFISAWHTCGFKNIWLPISKILMEIIRGIRETIRGLGLREILRGVRKILRRLREIGGEIIEFLLSILVLFLFLYVINLVFNFLIVQVLFIVLLPTAIIGYLISLIKHKRIRLFLSITFIILLLLWSVCLKYDINLLITISNLLTQSWNWINEVFGPLAIQIMVTIIVLVVILSIVIDLYQVIKKLLWVPPLYSSKHFSPPEWIDSIKEASPDKQEDMIIRTSHQTLDLNPEEFLNKLKKIQDHIKEEPALSIYWEKRDKLEQLLKQEKR